MGYVSPSDDERTFKAGRTELYHCSACGVMSRFARYTAVSKVSAGPPSRCTKQHHSLNTTDVNLSRIFFVSALNRAFGIADATMPASETFFAVS